MQWILQDFEDNHKLAEALDRIGIEYSMHKVVPFIGELDPAPVIRSSRVVMFGSYSLRHYAHKNGLIPGVFELQPFIDQMEWWPYLLNGPNSTRICELQSILGMELKDQLYFIRPLQDSKEIAGRIVDLSELESIVKAACSLKPEEEIKGSLNRSTMMLLCQPQKIYKEWRIWVVNNRISTYSLYKEGSRVVYRQEIDEDARKFARMAIDRHRFYSKAYVLDVCMTDDGYRIVETNCINAAGFYAADLMQLAVDINGVT